MGQHQMESGPAGSRPECQLLDDHVVGLVECQVPLQLGALGGRRLERVNRAAGGDLAGRQEGVEALVRPHVEEDVARAQQPLD